MKTILLGFVISVIAFTTATFLLPGLNYHGQTELLLKAAALFGLLNIFARPILKLLLMPLNFLTMGFLSGIGGLIILWLLTVILPGFSITNSVFPGYSFGGLGIPAYQLNVLLTAIFGAAIISLISSSLYWLTR
jgi:uncharacterized membrane protein YvlD (DUF360 family)